MDNLEDLRVRDLIKELRILEIKPNQVLCITPATLISIDQQKIIADTFKEYLDCHIVFAAPGTEFTVLDIKNEDGKYETD